MDVLFVHEILVQHRHDSAPVSQVRSTLLHSSFVALRDAGHALRWRRYIGEAQANEIEHAIAPTWMDVGLAVAHYQACDQLGLSAEQVQELGQRVGDKLQNVLVNLGARTARAAGLDPKTGVPAFEKLFTRVFCGGSLAVVQPGPKDLRIELKGLSITKSAYFRHAYCGHLRMAATFLGARSVYSKPLRYDEASDTLFVSLAWV